MQSRTAGVFQVVQDLLSSGMAGQLRKGDTLGLWTFNRELYAGRFPLQEWSPQAQQPMAARVVNYLRAQPFEKQASLAKVLPQVQTVIKDSEFITVIVISTGVEAIDGTPFDAPINAAYKLWRAQQQQAHMPFVTVLRARRGQITDYSVNQAPWTVELPPLPPDLQITESPKKPGTVPPRPDLPPLIVSGKKPEPMPGTFDSPAARNIRPTRPGTIDATNIQMAAVAPHPAVSTTLTVTAAAAKPQSPASILPAKAEPPSVSLDARPAPSPGNAGRPMSAADTNAAVKVPGAGPTQAALTPPPAAAAPLVQAATVAPPKTFLHSRRLWFAAIGCVTAAMVVICLFLRARTRAPLHVSLITHSLERKN